MPLDHPTAALLALTAVAAFTDVRSGLIPNWLTLPALALAPLIQLAHGGEETFLRSLLGVAVCAAIPVCLFRAGAMGGGDVKLLGAIGGLVGPLDGLELQLLAYNVLVLFACVALACRGELARVLRRSWALLRSLGRGVGERAVEQAEPGTAFRLGLPIFVSACTLLAMELVR